MPPRYYYSKTDLDTTWQIIEASVRHHLTQTSSNDVLEWKDYMRSYTAIHNFCTARCADCLTTTQGYTRGNGGGAQLFGKELYGRLKQLLETHVREIQDEANRHPPETLLEFYKDEWDRYTIAAKANNHLFRYLDRSWVKQEISAGKKDVHDVFMLHVVVWKEVVVAATSDDIADALVQFMETR